jgi:hypothetical protein
MLNKRTLQFRGCYGREKIFETGGSPHKIFKSASAHYANLKCFTFCENIESYKFHSLRKNISKMRVSFNFERVSSYQYTQIASSVGQCSLLLIFIILHENLFQHFMRANRNSISRLINKLEILKIIYSNHS